MSGLPALRSPGLQSLAGGQVFLGATDGEPRADGLRAKRRKKGAQDTPVLQCAQGGDAQLRNSARQDVYPVSFVHPETLQYVREPVRQTSQFSIGIILHLAVVAEPSNARMVATSAIRVAIHGFM